MSAGTVGQIYLQVERLVLLKLDEKKWGSVILHHGLALIVQSPTVQALDQILDTLPLHHHRRRKDVISNGQHRGHDFHIPTM